MREQNSLNSQRIEAYSSVPLINVIQTESSVYSKQNQKIILIDSTYPFDIESSQNDRTLSKVEEIRNRLFTFSWNGKLPTVSIVEPIGSNSINIGVSFIPNKSEYKISIINGNDWYDGIKWINEWANHVGLNFIPFPFIPVEVINSDQNIKNIPEDQIQQDQPIVKISQEQMEDLNRYYKLLRSFNKITNEPFKIADID